MKPGKLYIVSREGALVCHQPEGEHLVKTFPLELGQIFMYAGIQNVKWMQLSRIYELGQGMPKLTEFCLPKPLILIVGQEKAYWLDSPPENTRQMWWKWFDPLEDVSL